MKSLLVVCVAVFAANAYADAFDTLLAFSTPGPDRYADGEKVLEGEWYALVWSPDGNFDGIDTNGKPVDQRDHVVLMAKLAKDAHCPYTIFQVDSNVAKSYGTYAVCLLDTRDPSRKVAASANASGRPVFLNGAQTVGRYTAVQSSGAVAALTVGEWTESDVPPEAGGSSVAITAFKVEGECVSLTVTGMVSGVKYNVLTGKSIDIMTDYALQVPKTVEDNDVTFRLDAKEAKFFRVIREPLVK